MHGAIWEPPYSALLCFVPLGWTQGGSQLPLPLPASPDHVALVNVPCQVWVRQSQQPVCVRVWAARGYFGKEREGSFVLLPLVITRSKQESCLCSWTPGEANQPLAPLGPVGL